ncbi:MAG: tetratricopeptide repeat protein [Acidobacteriaceae bacterium]
MPATPGSSTGNRRIDSWKEIAAFFGRDERTVKRWEKERGLPVHRLPGERGGVFAYTEELTRWLNSTRPAEPRTAPPAPPTPSPQDPSPQHRYGVLLAAALIVLALGFSYGIRAVLRHERARTARAAIHVPDREAQDFYLKGRYYWSRRTEGSLTLAVDAFTQAVVHDSEYAQAYAGLAECYDLMPEFTSMPRSEAFPRAIAAAQKAIALDDALPAAHRALAFALFYWNWQIPRALGEYQRAIALDPRDEEAHHWYATSLFALGRYREAMIEIDKAQQLNPASRSILSDQALIRFWAADPTAAIARLRELEQAEPDFASPPRYLAEIAWARKDFRAWIDQSLRLNALSKNQQLNDVIQAAQPAFARGGSRAMLEAVRAVQQRYFDSGQSSGFDLARTCALLGRNDEALAALRAALAARDYEIFNVETDPSFARLNGDPRFEALKRQVIEGMYHA